jgi:hypothetical protein
MSQQYNVVANSFRSLASAELYLGIAHVFRRLKLELYETSFRDVEITWDGFAGGLRPDSKGIRVKVLGLRD